MLPHPPSQRLDTPEAEKQPRVFLGMGGDVIVTTAESTPQRPFSPLIHLQAIDFLSRCNEALPGDRCSCRRLY